jgi:hypothetical protein
MVHFVLSTVIFGPPEPLRIEGNCNHNCNQRDIHCGSPNRPPLMVSEAARASASVGCW